MNRNEEAAIQSMFTLQRLAHIEKADAEIEEGEFFTTEQVDEHFAEKKRAWLQNHPTNP